MIRFVQSIFAEDYDPTISDFYRKQVRTSKTSGYPCFGCLTFRSSNPYEVTVDGEALLLQLEDTVADEMYEAMISMSLRSSHAVLLVRCSSKSCVTHVTVLVAVQHHFPE